MSVTSNRSVVISQTSDVEYTQEFPAVVSTTGSGDNYLVSVTTSTTTVTVPSGAVAVTIIPLVTNTNALTLIGNVSLNPTDPSSFGLSTTQTTINLMAASTTSLRVIFS